jgi:hypothetical protein
VQSRPRREREKLHESRTRTVPPPILRHWHPVDGDQEAAEQRDLDPHAGIVSFRLVGARWRTPTA